MDDNFNLITHLIDKYEDVKAIIKFIDMNGIDRNMSMDEIKEITEKIPKKELINVYKPRGGSRRNDRKQKQNQRTRKRKTSLT